MALKIPDRRQKGVGIRAIGAVRQDASAGKKMADEVIGIVQGVTGMASEGEKIKAEHDEARHSAAMADMNQYTQEATEGESGYRRQTGQAAFKNHDKAIEEYDKKAANVRESLDGQQRGRFDAAMAEKRGRYVAGVNKHTADAADKVAAEAHGATLAGSLSGAMTATRLGDIDGIEFSLTEGAAAITRRGAVIGESPELTAQKRKEFETQTRIATAGQMIGMGQDDQAVAYFKEHRNGLDEPMIAKSQIGQRIQAAGVRSQARTTADSIIKQSTPEGADGPDALEAFKLVQAQGAEMSDAMLEEVQKRVQGHIADRRKAVKQRDDQIMGQLRSEFGEKHIGSLAGNDTYQTLTREGKGRWAKEQFQLMAASGALGRAEQARAEKRGAKFVQHVRDTPPDELLSMDLQEVAESMGAGPEGLRTARRLQAKAQNKWDKDQGVAVGELRAQVKASVSKLTHLSKAKQKIVENHVYSEMSKWVHPRTPGANPDQEQVDTWINKLFQEKVKSGLFGWGEQTGAEAQAFGNENAPESIAIPDTPRGGRAPGAPTPEELQRGEQSRLEAQQALDAVAEAEAEEMAKAAGLLPGEKEELVRAQKAMRAQRKANKKAKRAAEKAARAKDKADARALAGSALGAGEKVKRGKSVKANKEANKKQDRNLETDKLEEASDGLSGVRDYLEERRKAARAEAELDKKFPLLKRAKGIGDVPKDFHTEMLRAAKKRDQEITPKQILNAYNKVVILRTGQRSKARHGKGKK